MKVRIKLPILGILLIAIVAFFAHFFDYYRSKNRENSHNQLRIINEIIIKTLEADVAIRNFMIDDLMTDEYYETKKSVNLIEYNKIKSELDRLEVIFNENYKGSDHKEVTNKINELLKNLDKSFKKIVEEYTKLGYNDYGIEAEFSDARDFMDPIEELKDPELDILMLDIKVQEMKYIHRKKIKYFEKIEKKVNELMDLTGNIPQLTKGANNYIRLMNIYDEKVKLIGLTDKEGLRKALSNNLDQTKKYLMEFSSDYKINMDILERKGRILTIIFIVIGILTGGIIFYILSLTITNPLKTLSIIARKISNGDLTSHIDKKLIKRSDEIGTLSQSLSQTEQNLRDTVIKIRESSEENKIVGENLKDSAESTYINVGTVQSNLNNFTELFTRLDNNIEEAKKDTELIVKSITDLGSRILDQVESTQKTTSIITQMSASLSKIADITVSKKNNTKSLVSVTKEGGKQIQTTNTIISEIAESTDKMKELIELINNIASHTNLLSMNASIEAAHAGEAGKGFSVVADEIQKLSEKTSDGVSGISSYLNSIISSISDALNASGSCSDVFKKVNNEVLDSAAAFTDITEMVTTVSEGGTEMLSAIEEINSVMQDVKNGSEDIKKIILSMGEEMQSIVNLSSKAFNDINNSNNAINKIEDKASNVAELSVRNEKILEALIKIVSTFNIN